MNEYILNILAHNAEKLLESYQIILWKFSKCVFARLYFLIISSTIKFLNYSCEFVSAATDLLGKNKTKISL